MSELVLKVRWGRWLYCGIDHEKLDFLFSCGFEKLIGISFAQIK